MPRENERLSEKEAADEAEILKQMVADGEVGSYEEADKVRDQERRDKDEEEKESPELKSLLQQAEDAIAEADEYESLGKLIAAETPKNQLSLALMLIDLGHNEAIRSNLGKFTANNRRIIKKQMGIFDPNDKKG